MALRLRRGTNAERLLITPVEGELIYTTDTKLLYVGDGSTVGGTLVTGSGGGGAITLDALTDTDVTGVTNNQVLTWIAGNNKWEPTTLPGVGELDLGELADVFLPRTPEYRSIISYDGLNWTEGRGQDTIDPGCNLNVNIVGDNSTVLVNTFNNTFTGDLVGDVTGNVTGDLTGNVTGGLVGSINAIGTLDGDLTGSVFADDSTLIVDGISGDVSANTLTVGNGGIIIEKTGNSLDILSSLNNSRIDIANINTNLFNVKGDLGSTEGATVSTSSSRGTILAPVGLQAGDPAGAILFNAYKTSLSDYRVNAGIVATIDTVTGTDDIPGRLNIFVRDPDGNVTIPVSVNSKGVTEAPVFKTTPYDDATARDAAITSPEAGMIVYITSTNKLQCYNGTSWNDLF